MNTHNKIIQWVIDNKKGLIWGFVFGAFIAPIVAAFGILSSFFEMLRPVLIGPMDIIGNLIPLIKTGKDTYQMPVYYWIIAPGFNGFCYTVFGGIIQSFMRIIRKK